MNYKYLSVEQVGPILWVYFENKPHNFLCEEALADLYDLVCQLKTDSKTKVLILTGKEQGQFFTHYDVSEMLRLSRQNLEISRLERWLNPFLFRLTLMLMGKHSTLERLLLKSLKKSRKRSPYVMLLFARLATRIEELPQITVAMINGHCLGGGNELALCFDFRYMAHDQGYLVGQPEVLLGFPPAGGGTQRLTNLIGNAKALEVMLKGKPLRAEAAKSMGWVTDTFQGNELKTCVQEIAHDLSTRHPRAISAIKSLLLEKRNSGLLQGLASELRESGDCMTEATTLSSMEKYCALIQSHQSEEGFSVIKMLERI